MALEVIGNLLGSGPAFLLGAGIIYETIAANCSSPQTTELNAEARAETLMKWVHLGQVQGAGLAIIAASIDKSNAKSILFGAGVSMVTMELLYLHAKQVGTSNPGTPTESY